MNIATGFPTWKGKPITEAELAREWKRVADKEKIRHSSVGLKASVARTKKSRSISAPRLAQVLQVVRENPGETALGITDILDQSTSTTRCGLRHLLEQELIIRTHEPLPQNGYIARYWPAPGMESCARD